MNNGAADRYPRAFEPNTSHANAVTLLDKAEARAGLVLDIGCGNAPAAEPLAERGFTYVGLDVEKASLDGLSARGFETHRVDLGVSRSRLQKKLLEIVDGRDLVAILALDVLEHVVDPRTVVETLAALVDPARQCSLLVSIPNLTHRDVTARLMVGQWEMTSVGLLDDTHVRFFSADALDRLFERTAWRQVDALDTNAEYTEQYSLLRTPALQPGAPIGDFLRRVRGRVDDHATTYQFVRRFEFDSRREAAPERPTEPPFLSIVMNGSASAGSTAPLHHDLDQQTDDDFERLVGSGEWDFAEVNRVAARAAGHYVCFLDMTDRVGPGFVAALRRGASDPGDLIAVECVVRIDAITVDQGLLSTSTFDELIAGRVPIEPDGFDVLRSDVLGRTALSAYAVPSSVLRTLGVGFEPSVGSSAPSIFLARCVEMCSLRGVGDAQVVVDESRVRDADEDLDGVREGLGNGAFLLPPGGIARLAVQRRTLVDSLESERAMRMELDDLRPRVTSAEGERDRLDTELNAVLNTKLWRYGSKARAVYGRIRRMIMARLSR